MSGKTEAVVSWNCPACNKLELTPAKFPAHLREVHGIERARGIRSTELCLDGGFGGLIVYRWRIGELEFFQSVQTFRSDAQKRRHDDLQMVFEDPE